MKHAACRSALLLTTMMLSLFARAQLNFDVNPTYPNCVGIARFTVQVPQATKHVRFTYSVGTQTSVTNIRYFGPWDPKLKETYDYPTSAIAWSLEVKSAAGATLKTASGSKAIGIYTLPCNPFTTVGCGRPEYVSGVPVENNVPIDFAEDVDVASLTASGDTSVTVESTVNTLPVHVTQVFRDGTFHNLDQCTGGGVNFYDVVVPGFDLPYFYEPNDRMLTRISATWDRDQYSSPYQRKSTDVFNGAPLLTRPQFLISGSARGMAPLSKIWFKVVDPPDTAPYVTGSAGDNRDTGGGRLYTSDGRSAPIGTPIYADTDENGALTLAIEGAEVIAGDNYKLISSVEPPGADGKFPCEAPNNCGSTSNITVWKRIYYEHDHMATAGAFLAANVTGGTAACSAAAPCELHLRSLSVNGTDVITPGAQLTLIGTGGSLGVASANPVSESVQVDVDSPPPPAGHGPAIQMVAAEDFVVRLTTRPRNNYVGAAAPGRASFGDAVITTQNTFSADLSGVESLLRTAFIEFKPTQDSATVPYLGVMEQMDGSGAGLRRWVRSVDPAAPQRLLQGHRIIIASDRRFVDGTCSTQFGYRDRPNRYSFIYGGTIQNVASPLGTYYPSTASPHDQVGPLLPATCTALQLVVGPGNPTPDQLMYVTTAHEAVHQFGVNPTDGGGHCHGQTDYTGAYTCLMDGQFPASAVAGQLQNLILNLHRGTDSEYITMREERDPQP